MGKSKVLIVGVTSTIGTCIAKASVKLGHPTFALVRSITSSDPAKVELFKSFEESGITLIVGDLTDKDSLVAALKQVEVVISAIGSSLIVRQSIILDAIKETGTIKRFFPSEFGIDIDKIEFDNDLTRPLFSNKQLIRRLTEKSGVPYTFVVCGGFASYFVAPILQDMYEPPRDGELIIFGEGNVKTNFVDEFDVGTFTMKAVDDPRAENKTLHIIPNENVLSQNELTAMWEKKIGHVFKKNFCDAERVLKSIDELPFPFDHLRAIKYSVLVNGQTGLSLDASKDVEATELYPEVEYTTVEEYLNRLV